MDEDQPLAEAAPEPPPEIGIEDIQMLLLGVPERVSDLVFALTDAQLGYRHGPAFPTAGEVATHVAQAGAELDVAVTAACLDTEAAPSATGDKPLGERLRDWQRQRRRAVDLLRGLPAEGWDKPVGGSSLTDACRRAVRHEFGHLAQLRNLAALVPIA